jgi:DNA invertase Pin-like site-specific DNA recombinase
MYYFHEFPYNRTRTILKKGMRGNGAIQIGYMRISKGEQTTALQEDALAKAAGERTYRDVMSGARDDRPQFQAMLDFARPGDTIVVWRLDRLGRSLKHLIETVMGLQARGINFRSLTELVDTSTPGGKFTFHLLVPPTIGC